MTEITAQDSNRVPLPAAYASRVGFLEGTGFSSVSDLVSKAVATPARKHATSRRSSVSKAMTQEASEVQLLAEELLAGQQLITLQLSEIQITFPGYVTHDVVNSLVTVLLWGPGAVDLRPALLVPCQISWGSTSVRGEYAGQRLSFGLRGALLTFMLQA